MLLKPIFGVLMRRTRSGKWCPEIWSDKEIELLNEQLELLKQQKRGLVQRLLTGKIRVKLLKTKDLKKLKIYLNRDDIFRIIYITCLPRLLPLAMRIFGGLFLFLHGGLNEIHKASFAIS